MQYQTRVFPILLIVVASWSSLLSAQEMRMISGSGVRMRAAPTVQSAEVGRLELGDMGEVLATGDKTQKIGAQEALWYQLRLKDGRSGWVFGGFTTPITEQNRAEEWMKLAQSRLDRSDLSFHELQQAVTFCRSAAMQMGATNAAGVLELTALRLLQKSLDKESENPQGFAAWTTENQAEIFHHESAGQWFVQPEKLWRLFESHQDQPIAEAIAWIAASSPMPGECEGWLPCMIERERQTSLRYLDRYPTGAHAPQALDVIGGLLNYAIEQEAEDYDASDVQSMNDFFKIAQQVLAKLSSQDQQTLSLQLEQARAKHLSRPAQKGQ